ncbi:unnamed protein product [Rodentolepis nana]|uniref:G_PROTEIN_RECEP_F1_2 domain-containing protein n=1 Tax=Rodentolepis nana TaxID=102285 RepID=A0A0R3TLC8_RODNA|nr:unnamed protein product [Rodentolepis nana]
MCGTGRKKRMRFFILNLAITDIFVAIGAILPELILYIVKNFYAPEFVCRMVKYMQQLKVGSSRGFFALV